VESQACLLEYTFPRAFPIHTSYPASDRTNAAKRNKPLRSKVYLNLLPDYSAVAFLLLCSFLRQKNPHTKQVEVSSDVSNYVLVFFHTHFLFFNPSFYIFCWIDILLNFILLDEVNFTSWVMQYRTLLEADQEWKVGG
jgi:hypothetical protein